MTTEPHVLGLWDGHDSGAALLRGREVVAAINEERLTRRKLEVHFARQAIETCLRGGGIAAADVKEIVFSTTDFAKTLTRVFPSLKETYYQIRRRKQAPSPLTPLQRMVKYRLTEIPPSRATRWISGRIVRRELEALGFRDFRLSSVDHHRAHAGGAYFSPFDRALVITIDGIGDGLSGSFSTFDGRRLETFATIPGRHSLGIFFEHVTRLMNMRELEDEGKVMALANFGCPVPDDQNPLLRFFTIDGLKVRAAYSSTRMAAELRKVLWQYPSEQFCYMAQRALEIWVVALVRQAVLQTGVRRVVLSGGVASNIKVNKLIRALPEVDDLFVFPCMGDGGLALGAAAVHAAEDLGQRPAPLQDLFLGPGFSQEEIDAAIRQAGRTAERPDDLYGTVARLLADGEILLWFQGRMEAGPRALGGRSILALPNSLRVKDDLNLRLKRRVWYQPFCPSLLEEDARDALEGFERGSPDRFMTCGYAVKPAYRDRMAGVINVDGSCRPQIIGPNDRSPLALLLRTLKAVTGFGAVLNTSLNIHGQPLVYTPADALRVLEESGCRILVAGNALVRSAR